MGDPMTDSQESIVIASRREGPKAIVELSGELDLHSSPQLSGPWTTCWPSPRAWSRSTPPA